jgi:hypothetical protein
VGGQLIIVPWASVNHVEVAAAPDAALPFGAIKGARIVESGGSKPA